MIIYYSLALKIMKKKICGQNDKTARRTKILEMIWVCELNMVAKIADYEPHANDENNVLNRLNTIKIDRVNNGSRVITSKHQVSCVGKRMQNRNKWQRRQRLAIFAGISCDISSAIQYNQVVALRYVFISQSDSTRCEIFAFNWNTKPTSWNWNGKTTFKKWF